MRRLFVPACLCLLALPGPAGQTSFDPFSGAIALIKGPFTTAATTPGATNDRADAGDALGTAFDPGAVLDSDDSIMPYPPPLPPVRKPVVERSREEICDTLTQAAQKNDVPAAFFIHLLFQESRFQPGMVSDAGAEGIAQFMPETSAQVGLDNPYDPLQAIPAAARHLRNLAREFGNLGLAAAAYNAGARRIQDWLARKGPLPQETQGYVKTITGRAPETFTAAANGSPAVKLPRHAPCQEAAGLLAWDGPEHIPLPPVRETKKDEAQVKAATEKKAAEVPQLPAAETAKDRATPLKTTAADTKAPVKRTHGHKAEKVAQN